MEEGLLDLADPRVEVQVLRVDVRDDRDRGALDPVRGALALALA